MNWALQKEMEWLVRGHRLRCRAYRTAKQQIANTYDGEKRQLAEALLLFLPEMQKMQAVENAISRTDPYAADAIMKNIIDRVPPSALICPMGRRLFYEERRRFLRQVAKNLGCI